MAVFTKNLKKHIFVHPGDRNKLQSSIKIALLKDQRKYSDSLEGALLDVNKIQMIGDRHLIVNGFLSMEVMANFEVFAPSVGMTLEGVINKTSRGHYGCLVMDLFNASLSISPTLTSVPKEGDTCSFVVTKIIVDGDLLFMRGELTSFFGSNSVSTDVKSELDETSFPTGTANISIKSEPNSESESNKSPKTKHKKSKKDSKGPNVPDEEIIMISVKPEPKEEELVSPENNVSAKKKQKKPKETWLESGDTVNNNASSFNTSVNSEIKQDDTMSETPPDKSKNKHKKKVRVKEEKLESDSFTNNDDSSLNTSKQSEVQEASLSETSAHDKSKKKSKRKSKEGNRFEEDMDCSDDKVTIDSQKKHKKRERSKEDGSPKETKPKVGIDLPHYNPSKMTKPKTASDLISPSKIKSEPLTPAKKRKIKM